MERYIAIDNVCAWPNLTKMPDGTLIATIFNQPCHGLWEGDIACWASEDGGHTWQRRGRPAPHEPGTNRMNAAADADRRAAARRPRVPGHSAGRRDGTSRESVGGS